MELVNPESPHTKEMVKWEQFPSKWTQGAAPGNPWKYRAYPAMLYQARQLPNGKYAVADTAPDFFGFRDAQEWDRACQGAARFTESCQKTVNSEAEHTKAREDGWRDTPTEAMEHRAALDKAIGDAAAERNHRDKNMSEKAMAESQAAEAEHFGHLAEIPAKPTKRKYARKGAAAPA